MQSQQQQKRGMISRVHFHRKLGSLEKLLRKRKCVSTGCIPNAHKGVSLYVGIKNDCAVHSDIAFSAGLLKVIL